MKYYYKIFGIIGIFCALLAHSSETFAEPTQTLPVLYQCAQITHHDQTSSLVVLPWVAQFPLTEDPKTDYPKLFEVMKTRNLPLYGHSHISAQKTGWNVEIDPTRCAQGFWIVSELSTNFNLIGSQKVSYSCNGENLNNYAELTFPVFAPIYPLWLALKDASQLPDSVTVQVGNERLLGDEFKSRLAKKDKKIFAEIDKQLNHGNPFTQIGLIEVLQKQNAPDLEKRLLSVLEKSTENVRIAVVKALVHSKTTQGVKTLKIQMDKTDNYASKVQDICLYSKNDELSSFALKKILLSDNKNRISNLLNIIEKQSLWKALDDHFDACVNLQSENFMLVAEFLLKKNTTKSLIRTLKLVDTLPKHVQDNLLLLAQRILQERRENTDDLMQNAYAFQARFGNPWDAERAQEWMMRQTLHGEQGCAGIKNADPNLRKRIIRQFGTYGNAEDLPFLVQATEMYEDLKFDAILAYANILQKINKAGEPIIIKSQNFVEKSASIVASGLLQRPVPKLLEILEKDPIYAPASLLALAASGTEQESVRKLISKHLYDSSVLMRCFVASSLGFLDESYQAERKILLQDSEDAVVSALLYALAQGRQILFVEEMISLARRASPEVRENALAVLPMMMTKENSSKVLAFASNELFDARIPVKLAALKSISEITRQSQDPIVQNNAISALALTAQDKSPVIAKATLWALAQTKHIEAIPLLEQALQSDDTLDAALDGIEIFPHLTFLGSLQNWLNSHTEHPMKNRVIDCMEMLK